MIIIQMSGGLGNQMFQYALFLNLQSLGKNVKLDTSYYKSGTSDRKLELTVFPISLEDVEISREELGKFQAESFYNKIMRHISFGKYSKKLRVYQDKIDVYQPDILSMDNVYLVGYWQNEAYFKDIKSLIVNAFTFPQEQNETNNAIVHTMQNENSVSIHIRRGDYVDIANQGVYGNICTKQYYRNAIAYINRHVENPHYYLFSDDLAWVRENIYQDGMTIVEGNRNDASYKDMFLMSQCKHHIIANSTFSWWGAWLGKSTEKIVVAPQRWFQNHETTDIICKD